MITIQPNRIVIDIEHPDPEEFIKNLKGALLSAMRLLGRDATTEIPMLVGEDFSNATETMVDLLEAIIIDNRSSGA